MKMGWDTGGLQVQRFWMGVRRERWEGYGYGACGGSVIGISAGLVTTEEERQLPTQYLHTDQSRNYQTL